MKTMKRQWRHSGVSIINFEHISHRFLVFLMMTLNKKIIAGYRFVRGTRLEFAFKQVLQD